MELKVDIGLCGSRKPIAIIIIVLPKVERNALQHPMKDACMRPILPTKPVRSDLHVAAPVTYVVQANICIYTCRRLIDLSL